MKTLVSFECHFLTLIFFGLFCCSGGSSGMEMYDVSETRNADAYLVILLNFCNLWFLNIYDVYFDDLPLLYYVHCVFFLS